jgi:hypothetical protein
LTCSILNQGIASELTLLDIPQVEEKVKGEVADLVHGSAFARRCVIKGGSDYALSAASTIVVVTAGARQNPGESRLDLVGRNLNIFKTIIPNVGSLRQRWNVVLESREPQRLESAALPRFSDRDPPPVCPTRRRPRWPSAPASPPATPACRWSSTPPTACS